MPFLFKKKKPVQINGNLRHIAFIMDGNGRWAKKRGLAREFGHTAGAKTFSDIAKYCYDIGISVMTVYAFSTENWKRPEHEVNAIMDLLDEYLRKGVESLEGRSVRFRFIGDKTPIRPALRDRMIALENDTASNRMILNIAINYGSRDEICHALERLKSSGDVITEEKISEALYTTGEPDPDLIVRTGGEYRLSNFLLWQAAYSELYFTDKLWPDFTPEDVDRAIRDYDSRKRRYGGI